MKIYIKRLSRAERADIKAKFLANGGSLIYQKAHRLLVISVFGVLFALASAIYDVYQQTGLLNYLLDGILLIFCSFFIYKMHNIKLKEINQMALKEKKS